MEQEPVYPPTLHTDARSLISELLEKNVEDRLGSAVDGAFDVAAHPFFKDFDWNAMLEQKAQPPFVPQLKGPEDLKYFDERFTKLAPNLTPPKGICAEMAEEISDAFYDFAYAAC
ncbi:serine/threonine-protein kinase N2-like [Xenopus laevis]|uniref:Serine/threonine-protein kinase N2-like n=1 Tax=Xenopus laevis TaxID=8355 RepID=A0A8J1MVK5_XENLA|nr:serine/threonine-protein kinase N2-like [Xenopus laevis]XP_041445486.1 serine/threonine-protein kinase N2-like [Xenopus laevis]